MTAFDFRKEFTVTVVYSLIKFQREHDLLLCLIGIILSLVPRTDELLSGV